MRQTRGQPSMIRGRRDKGAGQIFDRLVAAEQRGSQGLKTIFGNAAHSFAYAANLRPRIDVHHDEQ